MGKLKPVNADEGNNNKPQADSSDNKTEMQQHEKLIDPGNEHSHHVDDEKKPDEKKVANEEADGPPY